MLSKPFSSPKCSKAWCAVCSYSDSKKPMLCQAKSVVYLAVCTQCDAKHKLDPSVKHEGIYVGESSRTLSERAKEHRESLRRMDSSSFMFKHWLLKHSERESAPDFKFQVVKLHRDPLSRLVREAVIIQEKAAMNSKSEWGGISDW